MLIQLHDLMAIQKPQIPGLHLTQLIGFFSVFIPISFLGPLGYLTRPALVAGAVVTLIILIYWFICSVRQKKTGYALLMIAAMLVGFIMWYLAWYYLCVD